MIIIILLVTIFFFNIHNTNAQSDPEWRILPNAPVATFRGEDIYFINPNVGWMTKYPGDIYKTTDGGESWNKTSTVNSVVWRCLGFVSEEIGFAGSIGQDCFSPPGTSSDILFKTTDSGFSWSLVDLPDPKPDGLCGIWILNESTIFATGRICGTPLFIRSTDTGVTWQTIDLSSFIDRLVDAYFISENEGFIVGGVGGIDLSSVGRVLYTSDGGMTWEIKHTSSNIGMWCWKIVFPTPNTGYVSMENYNGSVPAFFLKSTDSGMTWLELPLVNGYREQGIGFATSQLGWVGGSWTTYGTTDGGLSWHLDAIGNNINRFRMLSDTLGYALGRHVYKYSTEKVTEVVFESDVLPLSFVLGQNYPNPFNPTTKIKYTLPEEAYVIIKIYDSLGKEIQTILKQRQATGKHEFEFNGGNLPSGIYLYRLEARDFIETKKMILLK